MPPSNQKEKGKGLAFVFLDGTFAVDFVPLLISKLKLCSDCRIDLFFSLKAIFIGQLHEGILIRLKKRSHVLGYLVV